MISAARLRVLARERKLRMDVVERDYVNSWILYAIFTSRLKDSLIFKGGTALSKLYFPQIWRFSEDLDFTASKDFTEANLTEALTKASPISGITFSVKSFHTNPGYVQNKIQYNAILKQKNTTSIDVSLVEPVLFPVAELLHEFEDLPKFTIRAYTIEEIFVEKLRSLFQRARARDYYDLYHLLERHTFDDRKIKEALVAKCRAKGVKPDFSAFLDKTNVEDIRRYWNTALERLTSTRPPFQDVIGKIQKYARHLQDLG